MEPIQDPPEVVRPRLPSDRGVLREPVPRDDLIRRTWKRFRLAYGSKPIAVALIVGGASLALATQFGAAELAIGTIAAYVTYRMVRYGLDLKEALTETIQLERAAVEIE